MTDSPTSPTRTPPTLWSRLGPAALLALAWTFLPAILGLTVFFGARADVAEWFRSHELPLALSLYVAAFVLGAGLGLLPTWTQAVIGGYAFGMSTGFLGALAGFAGASLLGYALARLIARHRVEREIDSNPKARAVRDALVGASPSRTLLTVFLLRFPPNSPFALTNLVLAATEVPFLTYALGTLLGMAPRTLAYAWIGAQASSWDEAKRPQWLFIAGIVATLAVLAVIGSIANRAIERVTARPAPPPTP